jgi:hypothetical protein
VAAVRGNDSQISVLLENGANVNAQDHKGSTPLHEAALHGRDSTVGLLLNNGAHVNIQDNDGSTPLHCAESSKVDKKCFVILKDWINKQELRKEESQQLEAMIKQEQELIEHQNDKAREEKQHQHETELEQQKLQEGYVYWIEF